MRLLALLVAVVVSGCVVQSGGYVGVAPLAPRPSPPVGMVGGGGVQAQVSVRISFFGVPLDGAQDVVFVLDRSGSMSGVAAGFAGSSVGMSKTGAVLAGLGAQVANSATGNHLPTKLEAAKAELVRTLRMMPDGTRINVIWFDDDIATLSRSMLVLQPSSRAAIEQFIAGIKPGGSTAAVPALELAYAMGAARVVLLSDGLANTGGGGNELLARARDEMRRGVRFDTVGLGIDQDGALMQSLARESGGVAMMR
ncbi:MAG TPA: VWA domain-containing protein [Kofleriaceae bacterium]|nr:VWA domain-containing protein [Kofleriaceae bacterium]